TLQVILLLLLLLELSLYLFQGFVRFPWCTSHRYYIIDEFKNWTEAQDYCRKYYNDLATFDNEEEHDQVVQTLTSEGYTGGVWIGLYDDHIWKWSDQSSSEFRAWMFSEPNNFGGTEFCAQLYMPDGQWGDKSCSLKLRFVCGTGKKASLFAGVCVILE
uniref:C-type lectin domain-containing protein n=1 Tax=Cyprinus carpio TaxID=7962 RepID=A0A8C2EWE5_CYPCA